MKKNYQVYCRRQNVGLYISSLHREEFLAIAILDNGNKEELLNTVKWYSENFNHRLHVVTGKDRFSSEALMETFPDVTFLMFDSRPCLAEALNVVANECQTTYFFVTGSETDLVEFNWNGILEKMQKEPHPAVLCPLFFNKSKELIPTIRVPRLNKEQVDPISFLPDHKPTTNLYPYLGYGIYERALFQRLRGFDELIKGDYWQAMDFGTRCWLFGNPIYTSDDIAIIFPSKQFLIEDKTEHEGVGRFYTKTLSPKKKGAKITARKTYKFDKHLFNEEIKNRLVLYKTDYETLCEMWKTPQES